MLPVFVISSNNPLKQDTMQKALYIFTFIKIVTSFSVVAQIFNYDPIRHSSFETNPSYLASDKQRQMVSYVHQGKSIFSNQFAYDEVKYSLYSTKHFSGAGLVLNNTQLNDSISYRYIAIGGAYRNVLFNVIHTRIGFLYKYNQFYCDGITLMDYGISEKKSEQLNSRNLQNANVALSFSSYRESVYVSFAILNQQFYGKQKQFADVSPSYYVVNIGDLAKMFDWEETNVSFTAYMKQNTLHNEFAYFLHLKQKGLAFNRTSQLFYSLNAGYNSQGYFQIKPALSFVVLKLITRTGRSRWKKRERDAINLLYDFSVPIKNKNRPYSPQLQFSLTHFF